MLNPEQIKAIAKAAAHFHQALLVEGVSPSDATSITGNFILYFRMELLAPTS